MIGPSGNNTGAAGTGEGGADPAASRARDARVRLIATPIILGIVFAVLWVHHAWDFSYGTVLLIALFSAAAGAEMSLLFKGAGLPANAKQAAVGCALFCLIGPAYTHLELAAPTWRMIVFLTMLLWILREHWTDTRKEAVFDVAIKLVPIVYVGFLFSLVAMWATRSPGGVAWLVLVVKASDMAGWAVGVPLGKHKMIPSVSPGKSWEGTFAGVAASALAAVFLAEPLGAFEGGVPPTLELALFGVVAGSAAVVAGITWSAWKRRLGAKDSSPLLPEMGGVMDMVDSLILAAPVAVIWTEIVW